MRINGCRFLCILFAITLVAGACSRQDGQLNETSTPPILPSPTTGRAPWTDQMEKHGSDCWVAPDDVRKQIVYDLADARLPLALLAGHPSLDKTILSRYYAGPELARQVEIMRRQQRGEELVPDYSGQEIIDQTGCCREDGLICDVTHRESAGTATFYDPIEHRNVDQIATPPIVQCYEVIFDLADGHWKIYWIKDDSSGCFVTQ